MSQKGVVFTANMATEKVLAAVASIESDVFSVADVAARCSDLSLAQVGGVLLYEARRKALDRVGYGRYHKGGLRIKTRLPNGLVADAVWAVLVTNPNLRPLSQAEITEEAESYLGRPGVQLYTTVSTVLFNWHRDGHLDRFGDRKPYLYALKESVKERPLNTHPHN